MENLLIKTKKLTVKSKSLYKQLSPDFSDIAIKDALCDGEFLKKSGMDQEEAAEELYNYLIQKEKNI